MNDEYYHQAGSLTPDEAYALLKKSPHGVDGQARMLRSDWEDSLLGAISPRHDRAFLVMGDGEYYNYLFFRIKKETPIRIKKGT